MRTKILITTNGLAGALKFGRTRMQAKKFKNWTDQDFSWKWDGVAYDFPAGSETYLEDFKADHFASHLVDREIQKLNLPVDRQIERRELTAKCFPSTEVLTPVEALHRNEVAKETPVIDEFPDLTGGVGKVKAKKTK